MYNNVCKKCGSVELFSEQKGNNIGLYCSDCGAWIKWMNKDEHRAFNQSVSNKEIKTSNSVIADALDVINLLISKCNVFSLDEKEKAKIEIVIDRLNNLNKS